MLNPDGFRDLIDQWDVVHEDLDIMKQIQNNLFKNGICFFFMKNDGIFGSPEEGRISFARMKNPDPEDGLESGDFLAHTLDDILGGDLTQNLFNIKDLPDIKVIDQDSAIENILKKTKEKKKTKKKKKD